jgi:phosphate-selective porin
MTEQIDHEKKRVTAVMLLGVEPRSYKIDGEYDSQTDTWSNRFFETAPHKKHNEAR